MSRMVPLLDVTACQVLDGGTDCLTNPIEQFSRQAISGNERTRRVWRGSTLLTPWDTWSREPLKYIVQQFGSKGLLHTNPFHNCQDPYTQNTMYGLWA
jgi:hypothetical protein